MVVYDKTSLAGAMPTADNSRNHCKQSVFCMSPDGRQKTAGNIWHKRCAIGGISVPCLRKKQKSPKPAGLGLLMESGFQSNA
jgi:hypothetical protein